MHLLMEVRDGVEVRKDFTPEGSVVVLVAIVLFLVGLFGGTQYLRNHADEICPHVTPALQNVCYGR